MFNSFTFEKRLKTFQQCEKEEQKAKKVKERRVEQRESLVKSYNDRVNKFMHDAQEAPVRLTDYRLDEKAYQYRQFKDADAKLKGSPKMLTGSFRTERERINETLIKNQIMEHVPLDDKDK